MSAGKILIVEDEQIVQMHLCSIVEGLGHRLVGSATTPAMAHAAAEAEPPDLVLMDVHLAGGTDGIEAASALRERFDCAVLFLTAHSDAETVRRASEVDAWGYLVKPFGSAEVAASIRSALSGHRRLREARDRERALSTALDGTGEALLLVDGAGRIGFASPRAASLTGLNVAQASGALAEEVLPLPDARDAARLRSALDPETLGGSPSRLDDIGLRRPDGSLLRLDLRLEPMQADGQSTGTLLTLLPREHGSPAGPAPRMRSETFGAGTRLLVYSHDTLGLGHLRRSLNLVTALAERHPGLSTLLVTGSPIAHRFELPPGTDYLKLPAVRKVAASTYESRFLAMSDEGIQSLRSELLLRTARDYDPDVLLVDHSPAGMNGELLPALEWLRRIGRCTCVLGLRDVIDEPDHVVAHWTRDGIYDLLRDSYDELVVYGSPTVYDTVREYQFDDALARKTTYVHHVTRKLEKPTDERDPALIVVAIGGGDGGVDTVVEPFLDMLERFADRLEVRAEIVLGPFVPDEVAGRVAERARDLPVTLHGFVPEPAELYRRAGVVIATAGYNVAVELLAHADRALLIPRVLHRQEQLIRAERLAALGLVRCLHPEQVTPARLLEELDALQGAGPGPLSRAREVDRVPLDGAQRFAELCAGLTLRTPLRV